jgi:16S rRNA processing protein RimM
LDPADGELVEVGRIVKPHGIRGEVVVEPLSDRPERFAPGEVVHAGRRRLVVVGSRPHQGRLLVAFEEVGDRTLAERLRGHTLRAAASTDDLDVYLVSELVGVDVVDTDGRSLGTVKASVELPAAAAYDLLEIERQDGTTWLLPAVEEYVAIEVAGDAVVRIVVVEPPDGLIEG